MFALGSCLANVQARAPLVHNITNFVAMNTMANVQLALGASPAMVQAQEEVAEFAALSDALSVNIGTLDPAWCAAMETAASVMHKAGRPWVLDPVGVGATRLRQEACKRLLLLAPTVIRGNASEILTLAGLPSAARGPDSRDAVADAEAAARALAQRIGGVVAASGPVDYITDGTRAFRVRNGSPMMARVTTMGCALNGVIAAFCVGQPALEATVAALAAYGLAGEAAEHASSGPGTFFPAFLDALAVLTPAALDAAAQIERA